MERKSEKIKFINTYTHTLFMVRWRKDILNSTERDLSIIDRSYKSLLMKTGIKAELKVDKENTRPIGEMTVKELQEKFADPSIIIEKPEKWCPYCNNAQTTIPNGNVVNANKKRSVQLVKEAITKNNLKIFTKNELLNLMALKDLSNGRLQLDALIILTLNGFLKRQNERYEKDEKERIVSKFIVNEVEKKPDCINEKNKHEIDKDEWSETQIFGIHYQKIE